MIGGVIGVVFNKPLARSMMKYYPKQDHSRMFNVMRIAYVLIGCTMIAVCSWILFRANS